MKPTENAGDRRLLTAADSAQIRELRLERATILKRLRELDGKELAEMILPSFPTGCHPISQR